MMGPGGMPGMGGMPVHPFLQQQQPQGMKATLYVEGVPSDATEREVAPTPHRRFLPQALALPHVGSIRKCLSVRVPG